MEHLIELQCAIWVFNKNLEDTIMDKNTYRLMVKNESGRFQPVSGIVEKGLKKEGGNENEP